jgi:hypothetical protein
LLPYHAKSSLMNIRADQDNRETKDSHPVTSNALLSSKQRSGDMGTWRHGWPSGEAQPKLSPGAGLREFRDEEREAHASAIKYDKDMLRSFNQMFVPEVEAIPKLKSGADGPTAVGTWVCPNCG